MVSGSVHPAGASIDDRLPGADLVIAGLADLAAGRETVAGELLRSASRRLAHLGITTVSPAAPAPARRENRLWALIEADVGRSRAHSRYNALRRRLLSFLRAAEHASTR